MYPFCITLLPLIQFGSKCYCFLYQFCAKMYPFCITLLLLIQFGSKCYCKCTLFVSTLNRNLAQTIKNHLSTCRFRVTTFQHFARCRVTYAWTFATNLRTLLQCFDTNISPYWIPSSAANLRAIIPKSSLKHTGKNHQSDILQPLLQQKSWKCAKWSRVTRHAIERPFSANLRRITEPFFAINVQNGQNGYHENCCYRHVFRRLHFA